MTGFPPAIQQYLTSLDKKKRQSVVDQLNQLADNDVQAFEMQLEKKFGMAQQQAQQAQQQAVQQQAPQMQQQAPQQQQQVPQQQQQAPQGQPGMANGGKFNLQYMDNIMNYHYAEGGVHIEPSHEGIFTAKSDRAGMSVAAFANHVMTNRDSYNEDTIKQANFVRNFVTNKHAMGGYYQKGAQQPEPDFVNNIGLDAPTNQQAPQPSVVVKQVSPAVNQAFGDNPDVVVRYTINADGVPERVQTPAPVTVEAAKEVAKQVRKDEKSVSQRVTDIMDIQKALNQSGANIKVDGIYGKKTAAAVTKFQNAAHLKDEDGIVGQDTATALLGYNEKDWGNRMYSDQATSIISGAKKSQGKDSNLYGESDAEREKRYADNMAYMKFLGQSQESNTKLASDAPIKKSTSNNNSDNLDYIRSSYKESDVERARRKINSLDYLKEYTKH